MIKMVSPLESMWLLLGLFSHRNCWVILCSCWQPSHSTFHATTCWYALSPQGAHRVLTSKLLNKRLRHHWRWLWRRKSVQCLQLYQECRRIGFLFQLPLHLRQWCCWHMQVQQEQHCRQCCFLSNLLQWSSHVHSTFLSLWRTCLGSSGCHHMAELSIWNHHHLHQQPQPCCSGDWLCELWTIRSLLECEESMGNFLGNEWLHSCCHWTESLH